jgi:hypothetical protein
MPPDSTPHKHRKTGLFKDASPSPKKSSWDSVFSPSPSKEKKQKNEHLHRKTKRELMSTLTPYFPDLTGGKKTKKRQQHNRRYNKNKSIKNKTRRTIHGKKGIFY